MPENVTRAAFAQRAGPLVGAYLPASASPRRAAQWQPVLDDRDRRPVPPPLGYLPDTPWGFRSAPERAAVTTTAV
ncbi:hypothetical protein AB0H12_03915 [Actinosynnema sp. NPDC023794]